MKTAEESILDQINSICAQEAFRKGQPAMHFSIIRNLSPMADRQIMVVKNNIDAPRKAIDHWTDWYSRALLTLKGIRTI